LILDREEGMDDGMKLVYTKGKEVVKQALTDTDILSMFFRGHD